MAVTVVQRLKDARTVMSISMLLSILFAVAHDGFFRSLDGQETAVFNQHLSITIATAFAFVVKASLGVAIATAYIQMLWHTLLRSTVSIDGIDSLTGLISSAFEIVNFTNILAHPLLLVVAAVCWFIPIASVFPPGTLTVSIIYRTTIGRTEAYLSDLSKMSIVNPSGTMIQPVGRSGTVNPDIWQSSMLIVPSTPAAVMAGYVSQIGIPLHGTPNTSYTHTFSGPALECTTRSWTANDTLVVFSDHGNITQFASEPNDTPYLSWIAANGSESYNTTYSYFGLPRGVAPVFSTGKGFYEDGSGIGTILNSTAISSKPDYWFSGNDISLHIAVGRLNTNGTPWSFTLRNKTYMSSWNVDWNVTSCKLHNATYNTLFDYGSQTVSITTNYENFEAASIDWWAYSQNQGVSRQDGTKWPLLSRISNDTFRSPAYDLANRYTILLLLGQLFDGRLADDEDSTPNQPAVLSTVLGSTDELHAYAQGTLVNSTAAPVGKLAPAIQTMFQNLTVSLLSSPLLTTLQDIPANITQPVSIYKYNAERLWLSYGIAIGTALLIVVAAFVIIAKNGATYSNKFSTYYRVARDQPGADPLPENIAHTKLDIGQQTVHQLKIRPKYDRVQSAEPLS